MKNCDVHPKMIMQQINDIPVARAGLKIAEKLGQEGLRTCFVGGGVRDMLMGRKPKDIDLATEARPEQIAEIFPESIMVGAKFGVSLVPMGDYMIEVATFREEGAYHDRRRPEMVTFSTLEMDVFRRDFTCNAIYYDPQAQELIDLTGGVEDISQGILRTVGRGEDRFSEDALRILRAVRFAANLGFKIEASTWKSIVECVDLVDEISVERVREELIRGFCGHAPARFLDLLESSGILLKFLPEFMDLKGCQQPPEFHPEGDVYTHTRLMLELLQREPSAELVFSVLLHDIGKPSTQTFGDRIRFHGHDKVGSEMAQTICQRLRFSNQQTDQISEMVLRHMQFINVPQMRQSTLRKFLSSEFIDDELELHRVDCLSSHTDLSTYNYVKIKLSELKENHQIQLPAALITGVDLIELGMKPGPNFSVLLKKLYDAQLDGVFTDKIEGRKFTLVLYGKLFTG